MGNFLGLKYLLVISLHGPWVAFKYVGKQSGAFALGPRGEGCLRKGLSLG